MNEGFPLPPETDAMAEKAAHYIASMFLPYFQKRIQHTKTKRAHEIVKYHEYARLATQYRKDGKPFFGTMKEDENTTWGKASMRVHPKQDTEFPDIVLKVTQGYTASNDGYVEDVEQPQEVFILVDQIQFIKSFKKCTAELVDTIKHEVRHWLQINQSIGLPKRRVLNKKIDVMGHHLAPYKGYRAAREPHHRRDIEFKTNIHTYAFRLKTWMNRNIPHNEWKQAFLRMVTDNTYYTGNSEIDHLLDNIEDMKKRDKERWKLFVKELYREILA